MHTEFLSAICEEPDEVVHRLVYADWLEEQGTIAADVARAELIRVQVAREAADPDGEEHWDLRARERILLRTWGQELAGSLANRAFAYRFRGGFVTDLTLPSDPEPGELARWMTQTPIEQVTFRHGRRVVEVETLARLRGLDVSDMAYGMTGALQGLAKLASPRLRDVRVGHNSWEGLLDLLRAGVPLRHLGTDSDDTFGPQEFLLGMISGRQVAAWLDIGLPESLRSLDLHGVIAEEAQYRRLLTTPMIEAVERLRLWRSWHHNDVDTLELLTQGEAAGSLRSLTLHCHANRDTTVLGRKLTSLRELWLEDWRAGYILRGPPLLVALGGSCLERLHIGQRATGDGLTTLAGEPGSLPRLRELELGSISHVEFGWVLEGLRKGSLPLRRLAVGGFPGWDLPAEESSSSLRELVLMEAGTGNLARLGRCPLFSGLRSLQVAGMPNPDRADLETLLDRRCFPWLRNVEMGRLVLGSEWLGRFAERFGPGASFSHNPLPHPWMQLDALGGGWY